MDSFLYIQVKDKCHWMPARLDTVLISMYDDKHLWPMLEEKGKWQSEGSSNNSSTFITTQM